MYTHEAIEERRRLAAVISDSRKLVRDIEGVG